MSELNITNFQKIVLVLVLSLGYSVASAQDARLIAKNTFPSVVMLEMRDDKNRPIKFGSGFFVRPDVVVTNYHVIEGASDGFAKIVGKPSTYQIEGIVGIDKTKDLALLKVKGVRGRPLALADISKIQVGQEVFAFGNPKGLEGTISTGIISGSSLRTVANENLIQITAPISPGSSGGPVVNRRGEVIGVAVSSLKDGQNLNFVVPSSYLALLLANSKEVVSLSNVAHAGKDSVKSVSAPSLSATAAWLIDELTARRAVSELGAKFQNVSLVFDGCTMKFISRKQFSDERYYYVDTNIAKLDILRLLTLDDLIHQNQTLALTFPRGTVLSKMDRYYDGVLESEPEWIRSFDFGISVGDAKTGARVIKAFNHMAELCKEEKKKEPF